MAEDIKNKSGEMPDDDASGKGEADKADAEAKASAEAGQGAEESDFSSFEPEVRKTPAEYFRERQQSRADVPPKKDEVEEYEEGEELSPKAREMLKREIEAAVRVRMEPYEKIAVDSANERDVIEFLSKAENEGFRKYATFAKKAMEAYKGITAENAFLLAEAKFGKPAERGAERERERQKAANRARGGSSPRPVARAKEELGPEEIASMTPEQFATFNARIKGGAKIKT